MSILQTPQKLLAVVSILHKGRFRSYDWLTKDAICGSHYKTFFYYYTYIYHYIASSANNRQHFSTYVWFHLPIAVPSLLQKPRQKAGFY